jgi:hypothetical protein
MILEFPDVVWEQAWIIVRLQKNPPRYPALQTALSKFNLSNQKTLSPVLELFHDRIIEYHIPSLQYLLQRLASDPLPPELYSDATVSGYWRLACEMWAKRYDKQSFEQQFYKLYPTKKTLITSIAIKIHNQLSREDRGPRDLWQTDVDRCRCPACWKYLPDGDCSCHDDWYRNAVFQRCWCGHPMTETRQCRFIANHSSSSYRSSPSFCQGGIPISHC